MKHRFKSLDNAVRRIRKLEERIQWYEDECRRLIHRKETKMRPKKITWVDISYDDEIFSPECAQGSIGGKDVVYIEQDAPNSFQIFPFNDGCIGSGRTMTAAKLEAERLIETYVLSLLEDGTMGQLDVDNEYAKVAASIPLEEVDADKEAFELASLLIGMHFSSSQRAIHWWLRRRDAERDPLVKAEGYDELANKLASWSTSDVSSIIYVGGIGAMMNEANDIRRQSAALGKQEAGV